MTETAEVEAAAANAVPEQQQHEQFRPEDWFTMMQAPNQDQEFRLGLLYMIFELCDKDGDGQLSEQEVIEMWTAVLYFQRQQMQNFQDPQESQLQWTDEEISELARKQFEEFDVNQDGKVTQDDLVNYVMAQLHSNENDCQDDED